MNMTSHRCCVVASSRWRQALPLQSFNLDDGSQTTYLIPGATYGAAAADGYLDEHRHRHRLRLWLTSPAPRRRSR